MPKLDFVHTLDVNLERFLAACSDSELIELDFLLDREFRIRKEKDEIKKPQPLKKGAITGNKLIIKELNG